jgi:hypothetical protein
VLWLAARLWLGYGRLNAGYQKLRGSESAAFWNSPRTIRIVTSQAHLVTGLVTVTKYGSDPSSDRECSPLSTAPRPAAGRPPAREVTAVVQFFLRVLR